MLYIHANKGTHKDIKLENILLFSDDPNETDVDKMWLKLADFGLGKIFFDTMFMDQGSVTAAGTPGYMSPEM